MATDWFSTNAPTTTTGPTDPGTYSGLGAAGSLAAPVNPWTGVAPTSAAYTQAPFSSAAHTFTAPTGTSDPGFAFREAEGQKAIERSAAAKGTLLTPQAYKGLERFSQDLASQEYAAAYARAKSANDTAYNRDLGENQMGYQRGSLENTTDYGRGLDAYTSAYNSFLNNNAATRANQQDIYSRLFDMTRLGQSSAAGSADLATQAGNAQAAGTIGSANAWGQGLNSVSQLAMLYAMQPNNTTTTPPYFPTDTAGRG